MKQKEKVKTECVFLIEMFKVSISDYKNWVYKGLAQEVILPSEEGVITILDFHQPILVRLSSGIINVDKKWFFEIKEGIAFFEGEELSVIIEN